MSTREQVRAFILNTFGPDPAALGDDTSLDKARIIDSAGFLELIMFLEETYGFQVENEEAIPDNFDSVNAIVSYVERKMAA